MIKLIITLIAFLTCSQLMAGWQIKKIPAGQIRLNKKICSYNKGKRFLLFTPKKKTEKVLILLHGWGQNMWAWKYKTRVAQLANKYNVALIAPNMGKSNYMTRYYKQTKIRWGKIPGTHWIGRVIIPIAKKLFPNKKIHIAGVSTGARGALMAAENYPIFKGIGYLSGDWDIIKLNDSLSKMSYGPLYLYCHRWAKDNTAIHANKLRGTKIFATHSLLDKITPASQTRLMQKALKKLKIKSQFHFDNYGGHNWRYWNKKLSIMFDFLFN